MSPVQVHHILVLQFAEERGFEELPLALEVEAVVLMKQNIIRIKKIIINYMNQQGIT